MTDSGDSATSPGRPVAVRAVPIELCQFLKFGGLTGSGGEAKQMIADGQVRLNGVVETRKRKQLVAGDRVTAAGETIVVALA
jgi:ribosome-associated protein